MENQNLYEEGEMSLSEESDDETWLNFESHHKNKKKKKDTYVNMDTDILSSEVLVNILRVFLVMKIKY